MKYPLYHINGVKEHFHMHTILNHDHAKVCCQSHHHFVLELSMGRPDDASPMKPCGFFRTYRLDIPHICSNHGNHAGEISMVDMTNVTDKNCVGGGSSWTIPRPTSIENIGGAHEAAFGRSPRSMTQRVGKAQNCY
jgi:hypothetical protein